MRPITRTMTIGLLLGALLPLAAVADRSVDRTVPADGVKEVEISNVAGSIEVVGAERDDVHVTGEIEDDVEEVEIVKDGSVLTIEVRVADGLRNYREGEADIRVEMPRELAVSVIGTSADVIVEGVRGEQRLKSVSGDVTTEVWSNPLAADTVSGDIGVTGHGESGIARLKAVSGDVTASGLAGVVNGETVSGDLQFRDTRFGQGRFESTSGDIVIRGLLEGDLEAETVSGDVTLGLRAEPDAEIDISSFSGNIRNCFGPDAERTSRYAPGTELRFTAGDGAGDLRIKTLSGDVELCTD